jgi:hypothetical protein
VLFGQKRAGGLHWRVILVGCAVSGKRTKKSNVDINKVSKRFQKQTNKQNI